MKEVFKDGVKWQEYKLDKNGKRIRNPKWEPNNELPEKWVGLCKATKKTYTLIKDFVEKNFSAGFLQQVQRIFSKGKHHFVPVPSGSDKHHNNIPVSASNAPLVIYKQGDGQRTCLT